MQLSWIIKILIIEMQELTPLCLLFRVDLIVIRKRNGKKTGNLFQKIPEPMGEERRGNTAASPQACRRN
jgi:hypothetical protein